MSHLPWIPAFMGMTGSGANSFCLRESHLQPSVFQFPPTRSRACPSGRIRILAELRAEAIDLAVFFDSVTGRPRTSTSRCTSSTVGLHEIVILPGLFVTDDIGEIIDRLGDDACGLQRGHQSSVIEFQRVCLNRFDQRLVMLLGRSSALLKRESANMSAPLMARQKAAKRTSSLGSQTQTHLSRVG